MHAELSFKHMSPATPAAWVLSEGRPPVAGLGTIYRAWGGVRAAGPYPLTAYPQVPRQSLSPPPPHKILPPL